MVDLSKLILSFLLFASLSFCLNLLPEHDFSVTLNFPDPTSDKPRNPDHLSRISVFDQVSEKVENYTYQVGEHGNFTCLYRIHRKSENEEYAMEHSGNNSIPLSHRYVQRAMTSILNRCFDKSYSKYRYRICPGHSMEQYLKTQKEEIAYKIGFSNATDEVELEKALRHDYVHLLRKYNAVFKDKLAFIINDYDEERLNHIDIEAESDRSNASSPVKETKKIHISVNPHIAYLKDPMPISGLADSAFLGSVVDTSIPDPDKVTLIDKYVLGKRASFFHCYNESDTLFTLGGKSKKGRQILEILDNDVMVLDKVKAKEALKEYYVLPNVNGKKWIYGKGFVRLAEGYAYGRNTAFTEDFKIGDLFAVESDVQPPAITCKKKRVALFEIETVHNNMSMKIKRLDSEVVTLGHELTYYVQDKATFKELSQPYPLVIGKIALPRVSPKNPEIIWPNHLQLHPGRQVIAVRIKAPGFPSADSGPYFRILLSPQKAVTNETIELVYDSAKGFLLRQIGKANRYSMTKRPLLHFETLYIVLYDNWILAGRNGVGFEDIELFLQTGDTEIKHVGVDRYIKEVVISHTYVDNIDAEFQTHVADIIALKSTFYNNGKYVEHFVGGDVCSDKGNRNATVIYYCDKDLITPFELYKVIEEPICNYTVYVKSKYLCSPEFMLGYINKDIQCYAVNSKIH